jgi:hypothetical protein
MEKTWASGAIELLRHADSHLNLDTAFDKRIAFISLDNCVETAVRVFLSLPEPKAGVQIRRTDVLAAGNSFPKLVDLLFACAGARLTGIDPHDIEHFHRIRNQLYHEGTGFSVDEQYLLAYRTIATLFLKNLFGVDYAPVVSQPARLDLLILTWNKIESKVKDRLRAAGIDDRQTFKWEYALQERLFTSDQIIELTELRMARNRLVHSTAVDPQEIAHWVRKSKLLLEVLDQGKSA